METASLSINLEMCEVLCVDSIDRVEVDNLTFRIDVKFIGIPVREKGSASTFYTSDS